MYSRLYVFAEGSGADFVYEFLSEGVMGTGQFFGSEMIKPTAVFLANPSSENTVDLTVADSRELPVAIVNGSDSIIEAYQNLNRTSETMFLNSEQTEGFDAVTVPESYNKVIEHYMVRIQSSVGVEDCQTTLLKLCGNEELGLTETKNDYQFSDGSVLNYYEWIDGEEEVPLMFTFHGSGNSAEMQAWSSGLHELAAQEGFHLVFFENYSNTDINNDKIMEVTNKIIETSKCDSSRVYISGFSMGCMRAWALSSEYTETFAGAIGMNGFTSGMTEDGEFKEQIPFYANGGKELFLAQGFEFPSKDNYAQEAALLKANKIVDSFVFDESAGIWGRKPSNTYTVTAEDLPDLNIQVSQFADVDGNVMTAFAEASSAGHEPLKAATVDAWYFVKQFSRNEDGTITMNTKETE